MSAGSDIIEARKSASKLVSKSMNDSDIKELGRLAEIEKNAFKAIQIDAVKLFDDEFNAERKVREIEEEIHMIEWRNQISKGN